MNCGTDLNINYPNKKIDNINIKTNDRNKLFNWDINPFEKRLRK